MRVCLSLASDYFETINASIIKLGMVTASVMRMHQVLIILTLTFIQGHTDLNKENNKCSLILKTLLFKQCPFYLFLPIASSFLSRSYPKIFHPPPQPLAVVFFFSQHTPTPNRRYHTREINVKPDKTKQTVPIKFAVKIV